MELNPLELNTAHLDALDRSVDFYLAYGAVEPAKKPEPCKRCNGKGVLPHFSHVRGGICFRCFGVGEEMTDKEREKAAEFHKRMYPA